MRTREEQLNDLRDVYLAKGRLWATSSWERKVFQRCGKDRAEKRAKRIARIGYSTCGEIFPSHKSLKNKMIIRKKVGHLRLVAVIC